MWFAGRRRLPLLSSPPDNGYLRGIEARMTVMRADDTNPASRRVRAFEAAAELLMAPNALMHLTL